jgi:hypothetical protein
MMRSKAVITFGMMLPVAVLVLPASASAQKQTTTENVTSEDPNDKVAHDRSFEETRKHMQLHSEWSKKTGKMSDN